MLMRQHALLPPQVDLTDGSRAIASVMQALRLPVLTQSRGMRDYIRRGWGCWGMGVPRCAPVSGEKAKELSYGRWHVCKKEGRHVD